MSCCTSGESWRKSLDEHKVRWSGGVGKGSRVPEIYEVIVDDVTKQRALEDQPRQQATRVVAQQRPIYRELQDGDSETAAIPGRACPKQNSSSKLHP